MLMAAIICRWTLVETHTAMLFTILLPNETDTAHDIYLNFFAPETRAQVFLTVAKRKLLKALYKKAEEFLQELRKTMKDRNIIANGLWCYSSDLPKCLCVAEQNIATRYMIEGLNQVYIAPLREPVREPYGKGAALVAYDLKDFESMVERMDQLDRKGLRLAAEFARHLAPPGHSFKG